jgi:PAS domain S-box-containing protein
MAPINETSGNASRGIYDALSRRLLRLVFTGYLLLALVVTLAQLWMEYRINQHQIQASIEQALKPELRSLSNALGTSRPDLTLAPVLERLMTPEMSSVNVRDAAGNILTRHPQMRDDVSPDSQTVPGGLSYRVDIPSIQDQDRTIGSIELEVGKGIVWSRMRTQLAIIVISNALITLGLLGIMVLTIWAGLTRPLQRLTDLVSRIEFAARSPEPIHLEYKHDDELGQLVSAMRLMQNRLRQSREALETTNAELESRIAQRTQELRESRDTSEKALQSLLQLEKTALRLTENIPVGTYVLEVNRRNRARFTFLSDRFLRMLDLKREDVLKNPGIAFRCAHPDDFEAFMGLNEKIFILRQAFAWEGRILLHGETRWMSIEGFPRSGSGGGMIWEGVMIDITSRKEAEHTLKLAYEELTRVRVERSRLEERERLLQEMHDGFGSQLNSARIMAEQGDITREELTELLRECMADLYLVADTLGDTDITLSDALVDFRYRTQRRLGSSPVQIDWDIDLESLPDLPQRSILQIMRIVQEALNNALKHAHAHRIEITALHEHQSMDKQGGTLIVRISDDGPGLSENTRNGRGMNNMRSRCNNLGGTLSFTKGDPSGFSVTFRLNTVAHTTESASAGTIR